MSISVVWLVKLSGDYVRYNGESGNGGSVYSGNGNW